MNHDPDEPTEEEQPLLDELSAALGPDPMPDGLIDRAASLVTWFDVDHELVALLQEDAAEPVGVRGNAVTTSTYATSDHAVEVSVDIERGSIRGQLVIGDADSAQLVDAAGATVAEASVDELGAFELDAGTSRPVRLRLLLRAGNTVDTDWFTP